MTAAGRGRSPLAAAAAGGLLALVLVVAAAVVLTAGDPGGDGSGDETLAAADDGPAPPPHRGRFVVECLYSHSAPDDPIVHPGQPGRSHVHDFFGSVAADAHSTAESLSGEDTTCVVRQDRASYWSPALYDGDRKVEPLSSDAYYRAAPGVDPTDVVPFPFGFVAIGGDAAADGPQSRDVVGWACGRNPRLSVDPPTCPESKTLALHVRFPDCWDGEQLDSLDHRNHVVYGVRGRCPGSHPVHVPQLELVVLYDFWGDPSGLRLASGSVRTGHADFMNAWDPEALEKEVRACIHHDAVCGVPSI